MRTFKEIKKVTCEEFGITVEDFDSPLISKVLSLARNKAWWIGRKETKLSCPSLARLSGARSGEAVYYGSMVEDYRVTGVISRYLFLRHEKVRKYNERIRANRSASRSKSRIDVHKANSAH